MQVHGRVLGSANHKIEEVGDSDKKKTLGNKNGNATKYAGLHVLVTQHEAPMHSDNEYGVVDRLLLLATSDRHTPLH